MSTRDDNSSERDSPMKPTELKALVEYFPIGKALRYSPDAELVVVFDTLIVAYCVDGHYIYSRNAIKTDGDSNPTALFVSETGAELPIGSLRRLQLLVPDTSDLEGTLDYDRRAIIGRAQQFLKGHVITLMAGAGAKGLARLTTRVAEPVTISEGPYAGTKMVLLNPALDTLGVSDHFHKSRGQTHVPIELYYQKEQPPYACIVSDFSEVSLGLRSADSQHAMPRMEPDDMVTIVINLGPGAKTYTIKGRIFRCAADACVVRLEELFKGHDFSRFTLLDSLELKTGLLNFEN